VPRRIRITAIAAFSAAGASSGLNARTSQFELRPLGFVRPIKTASRWSQPYRVLHRFRALACNHSSVFSSYNRRLLSAFDPTTTVIRQKGNPALPFFEQFSGPYFASTMFRHDRK